MGDDELQFTNLLIPGIIEIVGDNGVGKTNFILHILKNKKVIYITTNLLFNAFHLYSKYHNIVFIRIGTFLEFHHFIMVELPYIFKTVLYDIFIDGLEAFFYTEKNTVNGTDEFILVMNKLKSLSFSHGVNVIVSNILYENKYYTKEKTIYNKYLGYRWCYIPNAKYIMRKKGLISTLYTSENKEIVHFVVQCFGTIQICC